MGTKQAQEILLSGLRQLEYRGYDSSGICVVEDSNKSSAQKALGKVAALEALVTTRPLQGTTGIAHTRWATHGEPSVANAHPHTDVSETIWLVHNGIIENWRELKEKLMASGVQFYSQTDTEVLVKLIGSLYHGDLETAVSAALRHVRGTYGIAVMSVTDPGIIIVARMGSPIVLGVGEGEMFVSSDPSALLSYTKEVVYLHDGEIARVTAHSYVVANSSGTTIKKTSEVMDWEASIAQKNGFEHFMLKEIHEAASVVQNTTRGRVQADRGAVKLGGLESVAAELAAINRLVIVGCGSAYYSGQVGRLMIEEYAGVPVEVELGSEYRYKRNFGDTHTAVLAVTQSGETADTLASVRTAKDLGLLTLGVVNTVGSTISRETVAGVHNHAGPEIAVASTKAFISQLTVFVLLTVFLGRQRGMSEAEAQEILLALESLPAVIEKMLIDTTLIAAIATKYAAATDMMYIGRQMQSWIAYEGSLKLKEVSYIHAEAYAGGELKHGSIAMLGPDFPVFAIVPEDAVYEKMLSNIEEVRARKAPVILLTTSGAPGVSTITDDVIYMPKVHPILQPIVATIPLQLFAYYVGVARGLDVDQPRNLAKSVTVE